MLQYYLYLQYLSILLGSISVLYVSPAVLIKYLTFVGFWQTTIRAEGSLEPLCDKIEDVVIASGYQNFNSMAALPRDIRKRRDNNLLQYTMDDCTLIRWYCDCHGLRSLSINIFKSFRCGGILFIIFESGTLSKFDFYKEVKKWHIIGTYTTRTHFVEKMSEGSTSATFRVSRMEVRRRREMGQWWRSPKEYPARPEPTVALDEGLKASILERVSSFDKAKTRCLERGLPCKLGMLFVGLPGTGKTSMVQVIAHMYGLAIYEFDLGGIDVTDTDLKALFDAMEPDSIALLEGVDEARWAKADNAKDFKQVTEEQHGVAVQVKEEQQGVAEQVKEEQQGVAEQVKEEQKGVTLQGVITAICGVGTGGNCLTIMTAYDHRNLPKDLVRPGRVDEVYEFQLASRAQAKQIFLKNNIWSLNKNDQDKLEEYADCFAQSIPEQQVTPAAIFSHIQAMQTPQEAIQKISNILNKVAQNDI